MKKPNTKLAWFWVFVLIGFFLGLLIATAECADITLSWDAPTTNADGTPLADLAGYKNTTPENCVRLEDASDR